MFSISEHISEQIKESSILVEQLELNEKKNLLNKMLEKYIDTNKGGKLWEKLVSFELLNDEMAWGYIKEFVEDRECVLFFNQDEEKDMFVFQSGEDLDYILGETYGYEFYVTDKEGSYLLCYSDHNILYACGEAESWLKTMNL